MLTMPLGFISHKASSNGAAAAAPASSKAAPTDSDKKVAEEKKTAGNQKMAEKKYDEAIDLYSESIELDPSNAVYYSNRLVF